MSIRARYAYAEWTTMVDPQTSEEFSIQCQEPGCSGEVSIKDGPAEADKWKYQHTISTGHRRFWETQGRATLVGPPPGAVVAGQITGHERAVDLPERSRPPLEPVRGTAWLAP
ncbi:hypothetical protein ACFY97_22285 [Streptomyces klenkii]|uniref:DUF7848 domain-containing protein n=1 Tax=Streptomyces klenkii TaxID=1420899 RepID=UPI0036E33B2E